MQIDYLLPLSLVLSSLTSLAGNLDTPLFGCLKAYRPVQAFLNRALAESLFPLCTEGLSRQVNHLKIAFKPEFASQAAEAPLLTQSLMSFLRGSPLVGTIVILSGSWGVHLRNRRLHVQRAYPTNTGATGAEKRQDEMTSTRTFN